MEDLASSAKAREIVSMLKAGWVEQKTMRMIKHMGGVFIELNDPNMARIVLPASIQLRYPGVIELLSSLSTYWAAASIAADLLPSPASLVPSAVAAERPETMKMLQTSAKKQHNTRVRVFAQLFGPSYGHNPSDSECDDLCIDRIQVADNEKTYGETLQLCHKYHLKSTPLHPWLDTRYWTIEQLYEHAKGLYPKTNRNYRVDLAGYLLLVSPGTVILVRNAHSV